MRGKTDRVVQRDRNKTMARLPELVEAISSLRGEGEAYYDARPEGLIEHRKEMHAMEGRLRSRLLSLGYKCPLFGKSPELLYLSCNSLHGLMS